MALGLARWLGILAGIAALAGSAVPARAQDGAKPPPAEARAPAKGRDLERTIYVPYKDLEKVFEKDGRGVFLPYEEFKTLWERAKPQGEPPAPASPPVDWAVAAAAYDGEVAGDVATIKAAYDVQVLKDGWAAIPLPFRASAIREVTARTEGAVLAPAAGGAGYQLIAQGPKSYRIELVIVAPVASRPGVRSLALGVPPAAVSRLKLLLPEKGIKVDVTPNLAATTRDGAGDTTEVLAFLGATGEVKVEWNPRPKEAEEGKPLTFVETRSVVRVDEGVVRATVDLHYQVLQAAVDELNLRLPTGYTLVRLEGILVREWSVEGRAVKVRLHQKSRDGIDLILALERALPEAGGALDVPAVEAANVERETGTVALVAAEGLRAKVAVQEGLSRVDVAELPPPVAAEKPFAAFRYLKHPFRLGLEVARIEPEIDLSLAALLAIGEETATYRAVLGLDVRRAGVFAFRIALPKGWQVAEVGREAKVKDWRVADAGEGQRLEVDLPGRTLGAARLDFLLTRRRASRTEAVELPRPVVEGIQKETGLVAVAVAASLEAVTAKSEGLRPVAAGEAQAAGLAAQRALGEPDAELRLAFRYARPPYAASFELRPRRPVVSAAVETLVTIADDVMKVEAHVGYQILYAGIRELRIAVPLAIADDVEIEGAGIQEKRLEKPAAPTGTAAPAAGAEATFRVLLQSEAIGAYDLRATWKKRLGELKAGGSVEARLGALRVLDVFSETGHLAVQKGDDLVIEPDASGLEGVDARELPARLRDRGGIFRAYRYLQHPYALAFKVFKYEFAPVLDTIVNFERLDVVLTRERVARCEAFLELQNNRRQFLEVRLPAGADLLAVYVDGQLVRPALGATKEVALVSLPRGRIGARPVRMVVRYDAPLGERAVMWGTGSLEVPGLALGGESGVPVARSKLDLWLPRDYHYLSFDSTMQRRFPDRRLFRSFLGWLAPIPTEREWGEEEAGVASPGPSGDSLDVKLVREGVRYPFVSLEAAAPVRFRYMGSVLFYVLVALFFAGGLAAARKVGTALPGPGGILGLGAAVLVLGAFAGEAVGGLLDATLAGVLLAAAGGALRYAFVDAPRARREAEARRIAERAAGADRREMDELRKEVLALKDRADAAPAPPPAPPAPPPSGEKPGGAPEAKP